MFDVSLPDPVPPASPSSSRSSLGQVNISAQHCSAWLGKGPESSWTSGLLSHYAA